MSFSTILQNLWKILSQYWDVFLIKGLSITLLLSVLTVFFGTILGALVALGKMSRFKPLRFLVTAYVEIIRGTPILLQLYVGYFIVPLALPFLGVSTFASITVALIINSSFIIFHFIYY